jgi:hypothetical protein
MEPPLTGHEAISHDDVLVHKWRVSRLTRLGIPGPLAESYAEHIDWHQVARLVQRGCPPRLALRILRLRQRPGPTAMTVHTSWREDAACHDADPDLFFPIATTGVASRQVEEAKRVCRTCPVQIQCRAWAVGNGSPMASGEAPRRTSGASSGTCPEKRRPQLSNGRCR